MSALDPRKRTSHLWVRALDAMVVANGLSAVRVGDQFGDAPQSAGKKSNNYGIRCQLSGGGSDTPI
jgi:hypothetical protein